MLDQASIGCPYCGEPIEIAIEPEAVGQRYVEDCQVCCKPMVIDVSNGDGGIPMVMASRDDE